MFFTPFCIIFNYFFKYLLYSTFNLFKGTPDLLVIQYLFPHEHKIIPAVHGNRKPAKGNTRLYLGYLPKPSTMERFKEVSRKENPKSAYHRVQKEMGRIRTASSESDLPRDRNQGSYFRRGAKGRSGQPSNGNVDSVLVMLEQCKREQLILYGDPELRCVLVHDWQLKEIETFCTNPENFTTFGADPTFNLGQFNLTVTTYRHLKVVDRKSGKHPVMIGPVLMSQTKTFVSYDYFFAKLISLSSGL